MDFDDILSAIRNFKVKKRIIQSKISNRFSWKQLYLNEKNIFVYIQSDWYEIKREFRYKRERQSTLGCKWKVTRKQAGSVVCVTAIFAEKNTFHYLTILSDSIS